MRLVVCIDEDRTSSRKVFRSRSDRVKNRSNSLRAIRSYNRLISCLYGQRVRSTSELSSGYEEVGTLAMIPTRKLSLKITVAQQHTCQQTDERGNLRADDLFRLHTKEGPVIRHRI